MNLNPVVEETEQWLRQLSADATEIREGECLLCYVHRMLALGCVGHRWTVLYRDRRAPRATAVLARLSREGACCCDCELFLNAYTLAPQHWVVPEPFLDERGCQLQDDPSWPDPLPVCRGVRAGSTQGCALWVRQRRDGW